MQVQILHVADNCGISLQTDANSQCANVQPHGGKMQTCLREHRALLTWDCQEQLFRQEVENADDLRLSVRLFKVCLADKKKVGPTCSCMIMINQASL